MVVEKMFSMSHHLSKEFILFYFVRYIKLIFVTRQQLRETENLQEIESSKNQQNLTNKNSKELQLHFKYFLFDKKIKFVKQRLLLLLLLVRYHLDQNQCYLTYLLQFPFRQH